MSEPSCVSGAALLMEYLEGELSPTLRAVIDAHVAGCPRCVAFIESYRATPGILRRTTARELPEDLARSLLAALRGQRAGGAAPPALPE